MGNQERLPEKPTDAEYEEATGLWRDDFRIRDLAKLLAQLRAANERAEAAERSRDVWQRCCAKLSPKREDFEAKPAALPEAEGAD